MTITIVFMVILIGIAGAWLWQQKLTAKPWLEKGVIGETDGTGAMSSPAAKIGLWVFMAVVSCLFVLLVSAYFMRMGYQDWRPFPVPKLLWFNTGALILSSVALQGAQIAIHRRRMSAVRARLFVGGAFAFVFLAGQIWAWQELTASGFLLATSPAESFFYLITGLHGLHLMGGLVALGVTADKVWRGYAAVRVRLSVEMCATYWHFLLFVWLVLFGLLIGGAESIGAICQQLIS
jgi:cytochrome c oxidase subunit 3